jgi:hypothetical protein
LTLLSVAEPLSSVGIWIAVSIAEAAAAAHSVPYIDLTALSSTWYDTVVKTKALALTYHANGSDATHTNLLGADKLAGLIANAIKTQNIGLAVYLR